MTNTERELRAEWRKIRAAHNERLAGCSFKVNGRFKSKLGVCRTSRATGLPVSVEVAKALVVEPALREQAFDTLYHEAAHALAGHEAGHGPQWKAWCRKLGANPERLASLTTDERSAMVKVNPPRYKVTCADACGFYTTRHRVTPGIKARGLCPTCGGALRFEDLRTGETFKSMGKPPSFDEVFNIDSWR